MFRTDVPTSASVRSLMSYEVGSVAVDSTLGEARTFLRSKHADHAPVVQMGALVGIVSARELSGAAQAGRADDTPVRSLMRRNIVGLHPDASVSDAAQRMLAGRHVALPVVEEGVIVGMLKIDGILAPSARSA